jgi:hypothetical protein
VRRSWFLLLGAVTGLLASAATMVHLGDVAAPRLFGMCFGFSSSGARCEGIDGAIYLFPGLIFGVGFAGAQRWCGRLDLGRALAFILASGIANAVATFLCVWLFNLLGETIDLDVLDLPLALAGAIAGAAGGALLSCATVTLVPGTRPRYSLIAAAALGLLVPLVTEWEMTGNFIFYMFWQGGYAWALASDLPLMPSAEAQSLT